MPSDTIKYSAVQQNLVEERLGTRPGIITKQNRTDLKEIT